MDILGKEVITSDHESIGKVVRVDGEYFTTFKKGMITDEEYRVPLRSISQRGPKTDMRVVKLLIGSAQLKHGTEFTKERPNSDLIAGTSQSDLTLPTVKPRLRYEAMALSEGGTVTPTKDKLSNDVEYGCDQCGSKFDNPESLEGHRRNAHGGPVGI